MPGEVFTYKNFDELKQENAKKLIFFFVGTIVAEYGVRALMKVVPFLPACLLDFPVTCVFKATEIVFFIALLNHVSEIPYDLVKNYGEQLFKWVTDKNMPTLPQPLENVLKSFFPNLKEVEEVE